MTSRPLLFYSGWPLGYHNLEAERKARALALAGYEVVYIAGIGIRNPRPSSVPKLLDRVGRKLRDRVGAAAAPSAGEPLPEGLRTASLLVAPPRQVAAVRRRNAAWVQRQVRAAMPRVEDAIVWLRWPTPELVDALEGLRPCRVVYECVDAYDQTPGITGRWAPIFARAERDLVDLADRVVVPSEPLAERFRRWDAQVEIVPHGVDLAPWNAAKPRDERPVTVGFVGTLDYKLEIPVLREVACARPEWRLRLIGPVQEGFDPADLADLANVTVEPAVPASAVPSLIGSFDLGIMPYFDHPCYAQSTPLKNLEYMAQGKPAVARWTPSLETYRDLLTFASTPEEYVAGLERELARDSPDRSRARRTIAEGSSWEKRLHEIVQVAEGLAPPSNDRPAAGPERATAPAFGRSAS